MLAIGSDVLQTCVCTTENGVTGGIKLFAVASRPAPGCFDPFKKIGFSTTSSILSLFYTTGNSGELIKGEFGIGHWFEVVVEGWSLSMNTPSLELLAEVMTTIKGCCDIAHKYSYAINNPARGGAKY